MKRILSMVLFVVSCLILVSTVIFGVYSVIDIFRSLMELANDPTVSGIDYLGIGLWYGICLFTMSFLGFILSAISKILLESKKLRFVCNIAMIIFALPLAASVFVFFM